MKRNITLSMRILGGWLIGAILLIGCNANDDHKPVSGNEAVKFNSWLSKVSSVSRASETEEGTASLTKEKWEQGDYIGIYMKENGKPLSDKTIVEDVDNIKYISTSEGKNSTFVAASEEDEIYYPYNSPAVVSFVAYYPYKSPITDYLYPIDINDQKENPGKVDLLYATIENSSSKSMNVPLTFHHQLTKLVLNLHPNLTDDRNAYFGGIKVRAKGFYTKANFSLAERLISHLSDEGSISAKTASEGKRVEIILIPQTTRANAYIEFELFGEIVVWNIPENKSFEAGKQYEYTFYLENTRIEVAEEKISPWGTEIPVDIDWNTPKPLSLPANLVKIPGGDFFIGSLANTNEAAVNEYPRHEVSVGTFWISPYEITNKQYVDFLNCNPEQKLQSPSTIMNYKEGEWHVVDSLKNNYPVTNVTWYEAKAFAEWLGGDLPSEAEWETACRAGNEGLFSFNFTLFDFINGYNSYAQYVNCRDEIPINGKDEVLLVDSLSPNKNGLYNMHGNVSEWCRDAVERNAEGSPAPYNYRFSGEGNLRVIRGGSYRTPLNECRSASRACLLPENTDDDIGFRVVFPISNIHHLDVGKIEKVLLVPKKKS